MPLLGEELKNAKVQLERNTAVAAPDEFLQIDTPENVVFGYEIVGIGSRFMAALVDSLIVAIAYTIVLMALIFMLSNVIDEESMVGSVVIGLFGLLGFLFIWGYYIFFEMAWNGRSPGKQLAGLRVIRSDGTPITLAESVIRNLIRLVDFLPFAYGVGVVTMFVDGQSRRLGDMAASTLVVRDSDDVTLESLAKSTGSPAASGPFQPVGELEEMMLSWPLERLSEADVQLAEEFLRRQPGLDNAERLAGQILQKLLKQMEINDPQPSYSLYKTTTKLNAIIRVYRGRR